MANKAISELPQAQNVNNQDLFVLEQGGLAKKLTAETFITEQGIINALAEALDGHGGIQAVTLSSVSGRVRTYLITFSDGSATTFQVYDGTSIDRITKTSTAGLTDTYTVFMNDGTTTFFQVTNGSKGDTGYPTDEQVATAVNTWLDNNVTPGTGAVLDRTLTMSNAAAPADLVGDLKSAVTDVEAGYVPLGNLIPNSYIATTGAVVPYNGWSATDYIPINDSEKLLTITTPNSNGGNYDAFYDENKTFITGSAFALVKGENLKAIPENAKYVRLSNTTANLEQTTVKWWVAKAAETGSNAAFVYTTTGTDCSNAYISIDGNANSASGWRATPYICIPSPNGGNIRVKSTIQGNSGLAFYDKNQRCIYAITGNNASTYGVTANAYPMLRIIQVPNDTYYIRFCVYTEGYGTESDLYADNYGLTQLLSAIGEENQSMMHFNEDILPIVNASANYGYHSGGYYNTNTRFCLLVTTDPHGQKGQLERAVDYMNQMPCFTCGVTLGDIQAGNFAENDGTWYTDVIKNAKKDWLTIIGNHDVGHNNDPSLVGTPESVYQKFIAPNMQYAGATDTGKSYYYKDVDNYKVRLICLNDYDYTNNDIENGVYVVPRYTEYFSQSQIGWLISTLSNTPSDYTVMVLLHNCPGRATKNTNIKFNNSVASWYYESTQNGIITDIVDAWQNGTTLSQTYTCTNSNLPSVTVSADFTSRGNGLFAGFLCGHAHADNVGTITAHPNQNVFTFSATAKGAYQNSDDDLPRQDGTKAADCITALAIDTVHKNVLITRIGSDVSNILAKREPSVIPYA